MQQAFPIPLHTWDRRATFTHFLDFDFPYSVIGCDLQIQPALTYWKTHGYSPTLGIVYALCRTANGIPAFKQRIHEGLPVEYPVVHANYTVPFTDNAFAVKEALYTPDFDTFHTYCQKAATQQEPSIGNAQKDDVVYMSAGPWVRFTHVVQPTTRISGSIPRIVWGRFFEEKGAMCVGFSIQTHHSLVDGVHIGRFYNTLQHMFNHPEETFTRSAGAIPTTTLL